MRVILRGEMLRQQLQPFLFVFKENAMNLFPHGMVRPRGHRFDDGGIIEGTGVNKKPRLCDLSQLLNEFATGLNDFRQCLDEYQAIADDDAVKFAIDSFEADIKVCEISIFVKPHVLIPSFSIGVPVWLSIQIHN